MRRSLWNLTPVVFLLAGIGPARADFLHAAAFAQFELLAGGGTGAVDQSEFQDSGKDFAQLIVTRSAIVPSGGSAIGSASASSGFPELGRGRVFAGSSLMVTGHDGIGKGNVSANARWEDVLFLSPTNNQPMLSAVRFTAAVTGTVARPVGDGLSNPFSPDSFGYSIVGVGLSGSGGFDGVSSTGVVLNAVKGLNPPSITYNNVWDSITVDNNGNFDGVIHLDVPIKATNGGGIGVVHWSLDLGANGTS